MSTKEYCEMLEREQREKISSFNKNLVKRGVLEDYGLLDHPCKQEFRFGGVTDLRDVCKPEECLSAPSIAWECGFAECTIEGNLPVPTKEEKALVEYVNAISGCCVSEVHRWPEAEGVAPAERHIHIICKGTHPSKVSGRVNQLILETMKRRGRYV